MPPEEPSVKRRHKNDEREVHCPVNGCEETPLARGVHLHILRSADETHGPQGEIPDDVDLDDLETAGSREVSMDYPEKRDTEQVARLCPFCERPYRGKHGVLIHLGQVRGREGHPETLPEDIDPDSFTIVQVDQHNNVVEVVEEGELLPSTDKRKAVEERDTELPSRVQEYIDKLRDEGKEEEAREAEQMLLGED